MLLANRYQIIRMLGEGGFGQTFLAEDIQMPSKRICVIKQLKPMATESAIYQVVQERFQREAAILERLGENHSQIPKLYAYFSHEGKFYLVQEWIEGETLEARVAQQGRLSEAEVRNILITLLPVLELIHNQGMIHRDIKPENIILRHLDRTPVLIDFGAVRETMGTVYNSRGNPTSSIVIGTPGYMPPEQAAGRPIPSSDLYSLGLTAIYLLTGRMPQTFDTDPQTGEILWQQSAPNLSPDFAAVLNQMVRSHPRDRFSSAAEVRSALESPLQATLPPAQPSEVHTAVIHSRPSTVSPDMPQNSDRTRLILAAVAGGGLLTDEIAAIAFR
ncbi:serine/threonine protein kinase, partial [Pseudanabaenaceae cyanobacterium LEGE 13415]|nr:serine/threonine protein kinase [Pseudanabaenaceae cyanobacterium LEGE 13415]